MRVAEKTHLIRVASVNKQFPNYEANAARLAHCWNTHAALLAALEAQEEAERAREKADDYRLDITREQQSERLRLEGIAENLEAKARDLRAAALSAAKPQPQEG